MVCQRIVNDPDANHGAGIFTYIFSLFWEEM